MAASPATSNKTVTGTDGNLSAGTGNSAMPAEKTSWPDRAYRLLCHDLHSLGICALSVLSKSVRERFEELGPAIRPMVIRVWVIMATFLVLALAVPPLLLVYFFGQQIAQVWAMAATLCFYVFFLLFLCVRRNWQGYDGGYVDFFLLSYGLLLVFLAAVVIGPPRTAVFFLHMTTAWAAGYLGYYVSLHRLSKGTEEAMNALPCPSRPPKERGEELTHSISIGCFVVAVLWTTLMAAILYRQSMTKALDIVFVLFYMTWIHAALWLAGAAGELMHGINLPFDGPMPSLPWLLVPCVMASPFIGLLSAVFSVLFQWLLLMTLVAFLGYNLAVYTLHTPRYGKWDTDICTVTSKMRKNKG